MGCQCRVIGVFLFCRLVYEFYAGWKSYGAKPHDQVTILRGIINPSTTLGGGSDGGLLVNAAIRSTNKTSASNVGGIRFPLILFQGILLSWAPRVSTARLHRTEGTGLRTYVPIRFKTPNHPPF